MSPANSEQFKVLKKIFALLILLLPLFAWGQDYEEDEPVRPDAYRCYLDLTRLHNDKLTVTMLLPKQQANQAEFRMPAIVPGTYAIYNFGRFVSNLKAFDSKGTELNVTRVDTNGWQIEGANNLRTIVYDVEDTWDTPIKTNYVFEPAGTGIDSLRQYAINTFGFFGYLKDKRAIPYELYITKPDGFYASTGAQNLTTGATHDVLKFDNYNDLADSPILYCRPDTAWLNIGGSQVLVSVYSPGKKATAKGISYGIERILQAQKNYLGGTLPVKKYAFIISLFGGYFNRSGAYGALEHSYSSFYYLPEMGDQMLGSMIEDIAAHEFFHIVTPLNIHSKEIHNFDFDEPQMSAHLWLYEGLTEYSAGLVRVQNQLITNYEYYDIIHDKIKEASHFNDTVPFTTISKGVLGPYANQYMNVYAKGALIGMCIDLQLRNLSGGKYGVQNLMLDLAKKFGKNKPFNDDELFAEITKITYPEIGVFLKTYVAGCKPLPLPDVLRYAGIYYQPAAPLTIVALDGYLTYIDNGKLMLEGTTDINPRSLLKPGDEIVEVNGKPFNEATTLNEVKMLIAQAPEYSDVFIRVTYLRAGKKEEVKCHAFTETTGGVSPLIEMANPTPQQLTVRKGWLAN